MKIVAVISEYNPFHHGHAALLLQIRNHFGQDTAIIAIMSGNYLQRGEVAIFPKTDRARCAMEEGADLVLELPFPHAAATAERFARAGVHIANSLGCVDVLAFGSESGDIKPLQDIATIMESDTYQTAYQSLAKQQNWGSAQKASLAYAKINATEPMLLHPNNILGIEYIRALQRCKSGIIPYTCLRKGHAHDDESACDICTSAAAARAMLYRDEYETVFRTLPKRTASVLREIVQEGRGPVRQEVFLDQAMLFYRLATSDQFSGIESLKDGLGDRFIHAAWEHGTAPHFFAAIRTKRYTDAYLRRALLYGMFGITRAMLNAPPTYTQVLAMNTRGQQILALARKKTTMPILTKPADYKQFDPLAYQTASIAFRADSLYCALLPCKTAPADLLRYKPYRKD